jgi:hypothetical protein
LNALLHAGLLGTLPDPVPAPVLQFLHAAVQAGFLVRREDRGFNIASPPLGKNLHCHVEAVANLLDGSWFKLTVLDLVRRSSAFADAHWSVEPVTSCGHDEARSFGETDVVCLALPHGTLRVISCKTSLDKPLEHLEALRERAHNVGSTLIRGEFRISDFGFRI